jgi:hypothetical protein
MQNNVPFQQIYGTVCMSIDLKRHKRYRENGIGRRNYPGTGGQEFGIDMVK